MQRSERSLDIEEDVKMENQNLNAEQAYQTILIVWFALLISQLMLLFVVFFAKPELLTLDFTKPILGENAVLVLAFGMVSIANLVIGQVLARNYIKMAIAERKVGYVQTGMIIGCALAESISLFALFLAFAFEYQYFFVFSILGIVGTLVHFPRRATVHAASYKT